MTDHERVKASLRFMETSKRVQDEADHEANHRRELVRQIMAANVNRPNLYRLVTDQLGAHAFTIEALELAAGVVEVFERKASDD